MISGYQKASRLKNKFLLFASTFSLFILAVCWFLIEPSLVLAVFAGFLIGICDNLIMFLGIQEGSRKEPAKAFAQMKRSMFKRIAFVTLAFFIAIKAGLNMLALFIAFLSIHVVCLVFVILNAKGSIPEGRKE